VGMVLIDDLIEAARQFDRLMEEKSKASIPRDALYLAGALLRHHEAWRRYARRSPTATPTGTQTGEPNNRGVHDKSAEPLLAPRICLSRG
jgi:hypothetical protein